MGSASEVTNHETGSVGPWLVTAISSDSWTRLRIAVAWAKQTGMRHLMDAFENFLIAGGEIDLVVGVDLLGTSQEALQSLLDLQQYGTLSVTVRHNESRATTFHPKIYLLERHERAVVLLGSSNLTEGGLARNDEANIALDLDLTLPGDNSTYEGLTALLSRWEDETDGFARALDSIFLRELVENGYVLPEALIPRPTGKRGKSIGKKPLKKLFASAAPTMAGVGGTPSGGGGTTASATAAPAVQGYVQTLQRTDVGVGQTTKGTARRSPEIFIPLAARDFAPTFWGWPKSFVQAKKNIYNRTVSLRLGLQTVEATLMVNTNKRDLRIRSEVVRSAGAIGDILRVEQGSKGLGYDFYVEVIPQGSSTFSGFQSLCVNRVGGSSLKEWGYY